MSTPSGDAFYADTPQGDGDQNVPLSLDVQDYVAQSGSVGDVDLRKIIYRRRVHLHCQRGIGTMPNHPIKIVVGDTYSDGGVKIDTDNIHMKEVTDSQYWQSWTWMVAVLLSRHCLMVCQRCLPQWWTSSFH